MWFQHDRTTTHFSRAVSDYLNRIFALRWIGRSTPVTWPPWSPDSSSLYFSCGGPESDSPRDHC